ncbi:hypothetical protein A2U01_0093723, partial [Trifolium medium]|nr:hypothetical protein [Trifolium medium]
LKASGLSPLRLLIRLSPCDCVWTVTLERAVMPAALFRGCWYLVLVSVLATVPFASLNPNRS